MSDWPLKLVIRSLFFVTSRDRAAKQARRFLENYVKLSEGLCREDGSRPVEVPPMPGVDEDMRRWSFYMILEHNEIVGRSISATVRRLARGEPLNAAAAIDPKTGVMPTESAGQEQLPRFQNSVNDHLTMLGTLGRLRGTRTSPHPLFGNFDAHNWHCMFAFHLRIHYRQAQYVVRAVKAKRAGAVDTR